MVSEDAYIFMLLGNYAKIVSEHPSEIHVCSSSWASLIAQLVKNPRAMQETPDQFLGWKDLLEKGQDTHSSILGLPLWLSW